MSLQVQFPDLTEYFELRDEGDVPRRKQFKTEFAFAISAQYQYSPELLTRMTGLGFEPICKMRNWHMMNTDPLTFWWKRNTKFTKRNPSRRRWANVRGLAAGGCGFKLGTGKMDRDRFCRFFTLMRFTRKITPKQLRTLERWNYRHLAKGKTADYWINGWRIQWEWKKEKAFFRRLGVDVQHTGWDLNDLNMDY